MYLEVVSTQQFVQPEFSSKGFEKPYSADYEG